MNTTPLHLLIAEDEAAHVEAIRRAFEGAGTDVEIRAVGTLREYRACFAERPPDLALVDLNLPDGKAMEILTQPPEDAPFPVLVMTAFGNQQIVVEVMKAGALDYIVKSPEAFANMPHTAERVLHEWQLLLNHKQAAAALAREQEMVSQLIEGVPDHIYFKDRASRFLRVNASMAARLDLIDPRDALGKTDADFFDAAHAQDALADEQRLMATGEAVIGKEEREVWSGGRLAWVSTTKLPLHDAGGQVIGLMGISRDITARKQAFDLAQQTAHEWQTTFDAVSDAVWVLDANHRVVRSNQAAAKIFDCPLSGIKGKPCWETAHGSTGPVAGCPFELARGSLRPERMELQQGNRWFDIRVYPILIQAGQFHGAVHIVADITNQRATEERLRQSQKMEVVGQLAGGVAHDFNNLLNVIIGYSEMALAKLEPTNPVFGQISQVRKAGERAAGLTRQLLAFSRKQVIEPKVLDLNAVINDLYKMLRRLVREDIEMVLTLVPALDRVRADPTQIEQVLTNLVVNARDAMPRGGKLAITTGNVTLAAADIPTHSEAPPGEYVQLTIRDTGIGMTEEIKARLFEPFFTTKGVGQGTGLGLATCDGAVKQNGGFIAVESALGKGTTFHVYLPRVASRLDRTPGDETIGSLPVGSETILLVEDNDAVKEMAGLMLTELGYQVLVAGDGVAALAVAQAKEGPIHMLLTDVVMPRMNGKLLADELRKRYPKIKVLFVSGYTAAAIVSDGVLEPGVAFLQKPYFSFALACKVREVLDA